MAVKDRALITTGAVGLALAAICCAAPFLAMVLGAFSVTAWLAKAAFAVIRRYWCALGSLPTGLIVGALRQYVVHPHRTIRKSSHEQLLRKIGH